MMIRSFDPHAGVEAPFEPDHTCPICGGGVSPAGFCLGCGWPECEAIA